MPKLKELSGKFKADGQYNLAEYNLYLNSLVLSTKEIQTEVRNVARRFIDTVMVEQKWYDDAAASFAGWWDTEGVVCLNKISTVVEELVRITATDVCHKMKKSEQTAKSYKKYGQIQKFADAADQYVLIDNITKKDLGTIGKTECKEGAVIIAEENALTTLANSVSASFDRIDDHITQIKHLEVIQSQLYNRMLSAQNITNDTTKEIKAALTTNYVKGSEGLGSSIGTVS